MKSLHKLILVWEYSLSTTYIIFKCLSLKQGLDLTQVTYNNVTKTWL